MRRDSWRSVPTMCRPPASLTASWRFCHSAFRRARVASSTGSPVSASRSASSASSEPPSTMSVPRPAMLVAMVTAPGRPAWDDGGFAFVLLGVEHLVVDAGLAELLAEQFGDFDRGRADQHRLVARVRFLELGDHRAVLAGAVEEHGFGARADEHT